SVDNFYASTIFSTAPVQLAYRRHFGVRTRHHEDSVFYALYPMALAIFSDSPRTLDDKLRLHRSRLLVVSDMHNPIVATALMQRQAVLLFKNEIIPRTAGFQHRSRRCAPDNPASDDHYIRDFHCEAPAHPMLTVRAAGYLNFQLRGNNVHS